MKKCLFYGWINVALLLLIYMLLMMAPLLSFGVVSQSMTAELGMSRTAASLSYSVMSLISGVFAAASGILCRQIGSRRAILAGSVFMAAGSLLMFLWGRSGAALYAVYVIFYGTGLTVGTIIPINSLIAAWFNKSRGAAMALVSCGAGAAGFILNPLFATVMERTGSWRNVYLLLFAFAVVSFFLALALRERPSAAEMSRELPVEGEGRTEAPASALWTIGTARRQKAFYMLVVCVGTCSFTQTSINTHAVSHLTAGGLTASTAALVVAIFSLVSIPCRLAAGILCDKVGPKKALSAGFLCLIVGISVLSGVRGFTSGCVFAVISGIGYGLAYASLSPTIARFFGSASFSLIYGAIYSVAAVINAAAPSVMGFCYDLRGDYRLSWSLLTVLLSAAALCGLFMRPPGVCPNEKGGETPDRKM